MHFTNAKSQSSTDFYRLGGVSATKAIALWWPLNRIQGFIRFQLHFFNLKATSPLYTDYDMLKPVQGHCLDGTSISHYLWLEFIKVRYQQLFQVVCVVDKLRVFVSVKTELAGANDWALCDLSSSEMTFLLASMMQMSSYVVWRIF